MSASLLAFCFKAHGFYCSFVLFAFRNTRRCHSFLEKTKKEIGSFKQGVIFLVIYLNPCWTELNYHYEGRKKISNLFVLLLLLVALSLFYFNIYSS